MDHDVQHVDRDQAIQGLFMDNGESRMDSDAFTLDHVDDYGQDATGNEDVWMSEGTLQGCALEKAKNLQDIQTWLNAQPCSVLMHLIWLIRVHCPMN